MSDDIELKINQAANECASRYAYARHIQAYGYSGQINQKFSKFLCEIGIPQYICGDTLKSYYNRNTYAHGIVNTICGKVWENYPFIVEGEEDKKDKKETPTEKEIKKFARRTKLWPSLYDADIRRTASEYSALIINIADGEEGESPEAHWRRPVGQIKEEQVKWFTPVWQEHLRVDERDPVTQEPLTYTYLPYKDNSVSNTNTKAAQSYTIDASRVFVFGDIYGYQDVVTAGNRAIIPVINQLAMIEMIEGAATTGTVKSAAGHMKFIFDKESNIQDLAQLYNVPVTDLNKKFNELVEKINNGLSSAVVGQQMDVSGIDINIPDITDIYHGLKESLAAGTPLNLSDIRGIETGERSSSENARSFAQKMESRQRAVECPEIEDIFRRFQSWGMFGSEELVCVFPSLLEPTPEEKLTNANLMADIIVKLTGVADTAPHVEKLNEMLEVEGAPLSQMEQEIDDMGEQIKEDIDNLPD